MHVHLSVSFYVHLYVHGCVRVCKLCLCTFRDLESGLSATCVNTRKCDLANAIGRPKPPKSDRVYEALERLPQLAHASPTYDGDSLFH